MAHRASNRPRTGYYVEWVTVRNRTVYVLGTALVAAVLGGLGIYLWMERPFKPADAPPADQPAADNSARFLELHGTVKVRRAGSYEWVDADDSIALLRNDTVRTVGKSNARIRLFDGTEYLVKPDTIFIIEVMYEDPETRARHVAVELTAGQVNLQTPQRNVAGSRSELSTPTTDATFDEMTIADVGYDQSRGVSDFAVVRGGTRLKAGGQEVQLGSSQAIRVSKDDRFSEIIKLPGVPVLESPAHLSRLYSPDPTRETIELRWKPVPEASRYHVLLDRTPNWADPQEYRVRDLRVLVPGLLPGTYYWSVSAIDASNREGGLSDFAKFTVTTQAPTAAPPKLQLAQPSVAVDGLVTVNGVTEPDAVVTVNDKRVEVKPDGSFRYYFTITQPGRHPIVVKAHNRSGGTAEKTVFATLGSD